MGKTAALLLATLLLLTISSFTAAEGLPVAKYLEDPEHKNEVMAFYLSTLFTGINLANNRTVPPLFCMNSSNPESAYALIDKKINTLQKEKKLTEDTTVDTIMIDILIAEYPCK